MTYFKTKKDANHFDVIKHLRAHGVEVINLSAAKKLPDTLCHFRGFSAFIEIKIEGSAAKYTAIQLSTIANTSMPVGIAKTPEQALNIIKNRHVLTQKQKNDLALMLRNNPKDFYTPNEVETILS